MKRLANYLIAMALMAFTFTSCEDVPNPFGQILPPGGNEEVETFEPAGSGTLADPFNVQGVLEYVTALGADVQSDSDARRRFARRIPATTSIPRLRRRQWDLVQET